MKNVSITKKTIAKETIAKVFTAGKKNRIKTYQELTFTDDFMFCKVMQNNPDICREMTELILGREIGNIVQIDKQHPIEITSDGHGVRFDVYFRDDRNTAADIEMQTVQYPNLPKRSRYYQSMIDLDLLEKGTDYEDLPQSYVIFICLENPFPEFGLHKYTFSRVCRENKQLEMEEGSEIIFLSARGDKEDISEGMRNFLNYLTGRNAEDGFTEKLERAVQKAKTRQEWSVEYMTLYEIKKMEFEAGKAEGLEAGKVLALHDIGWSNEKIAENNNIPLERVAFIIQNDENNK